jgi:uncharacterized membrane protein
MYLMSILTLGIFWVAQQTQLNYPARSDRHLTWIHLAFLFAVSILPFSTRLLAEFPALRVVLLAYWGNLALLGGVLYASCDCATRAGLLKESERPGVVDAICRRIVAAHAPYAAGALLCILRTSWSIAFIVTVQVN